MEFNARIKQVVCFKIHIFIMYINFKVVILVLNFHLIELELRYIKSFENPQS